jgi:hypothetical protein
MGLRRVYVGGRVSGIAGLIALRRSIAIAAAFPVQIRPVSSNTARLHASLSSFAAISRSDSITSAMILRAVTSLSPRLTRSGGIIH